MRGRGRGRTPQTVVDQLRKAVNQSSQLAVARETGIGIASINRYLQGKGEPSQQTIEKLARYLDIPLVELLGESVFEDDIIDSLEEAFTALEDLSNSRDLSMKDRDNLVTVADVFCKLSKRVSLLQRNEKLLKSITHFLATFPVDSKF